MAYSTNAGDGLPAQTGDIDRAAPSTTNKTAGEDKPLNVGDASTCCGAGNKASVESTSREGGGDIEIPDDQGRNFSTPHPRQSKTNETGVTQGRTTQRKGEDSTPDRAGPSDDIENRTSDGLDADSTVF